MDSGLLLLVTGVIACICDLIRTLLELGYVLGWWQ